MDRSPDPPSPAGLEARPLVRRVGCRRCGYDLRGLALGGTCPECGTSVWETVLDVVDPAAGQLPPIRRPVAVGNAIVAVVTLLSVGLLLHALPFLVLLFRGATSLRERFFWIAAGCVFAALIPAAILRPPPEVAHERRVRLAILWLALGLLTLALAMASMGCAWGAPRVEVRGGSGFGGPGFGGTIFAPTIGFGLAVTTFYAALIVTFFMLRRLIVTIGERSRQFRTARGGRQRIRDLVVATAAHAFGFALFIIDAARDEYAVSGRAELTLMGRSGITIILVSSLMLAIGLVYLVVNMVWIRSALRSPAPTLRDLMELPPDAAADPDTMVLDPGDTDPEWSARLQALWNYDDPAATEAAFRALEDDATSTPVRHAEWLAHLARTHSLRCDFDAAHARLDEAVALATPAMTAVAARIALERGRTFNSAKDRDAARAQFEIAWRTARDHGHDGLAVDAAHMLAIVSEGTTALTWNQRALKLAEASDEPDARRWVGSLCNNLGWTCHDDLDDPTTALAYFDRALAARREAGVESDVRLARWCRARCLRTLGRLDEALAEQEALAASGDADGYVAEELGECLLALGRLDAARPHFARAAEQLGAIGWLAEAEPERIARLRDLGAGTRDD